MLVEGALRHARVLMDVDDAGVARRRAADQREVDHDAVARVEPGERSDREQRHRVAGLRLEVRGGELGGVSRCS